jgi:uridine phosphorylase
MNSNEAVIHPRRSHRSPDPGSVVILVSSQKDMQALCDLQKAKPDHSMAFLMSRICTFAVENQRFSIIGPIIGAPYAAILLENLIAWGVRHFLFFGLCGSVSPETLIGDIVLPGGSYIEEGTSLHYGKATGDVSFCSGDILQSLKESCTAESLDFREGLVWTTDAVFRETRELIRSYQEKGAIAVEMELSALFTIGNYRGVNVGAVLVVSDELFTYQWKPGFGSDRFKKQCKTVQRMISNSCLKFAPLK